jgi:c-di-AMP phosphodiesterase-like protein
LQSVFAGAITALVTTILLTGEPKSKKDMFLRLTFHYISLCVIMVIIGFSFNWIPHSIMGVIFMIAAVGVVYIFTALSYMFTSQKEIKELNKALNEKYHNGTSETD